MNVITPTLVSTGQIGSVKDVFRAINAKFKEPLQRPYPNLGIRLYGVSRVYEAAAAITYSGSDVSIEVDGVEYVLGAPTDIYDLAAKANDVLDIGWYFVNPDGAIVVEGFHDFGDFIQGGVAVFTPEAETDIDILPVQTDINRELALRISNVSASITPAALTKVDDTNVVLTLGGSPSIALLNATSLTLSWTGVLSLARGGTNKNITASAGSVVYSDADSFELSGVGTSGQALVSGGTGAPVWYAPTAGSVLFAGTGGILQQDNANFFWDDSNNRLGIGGTTTPNTTLEVYGTTFSSTLPFITATGVGVTLNNGTGRSVITSYYSTAGGSNSSSLDFIPDIGLHSNVGMRFVRYNVKGSDDAFMELFSGATGWSIFEGLGGSGLFLTTFGSLPIAFGTNRIEQMRLSTSGLLENGLSSYAVTQALLKLTNTGASISQFVSNASPELAITGSTGDFCYTSTGAPYVKATGTATNTGWVQLATASAVSLPLNQIGYGTGSGITSSPIFIFDEANEIFSLTDPAQSDSCVNVDYGNRTMLLYMEGLSATEVAYINLDLTTPGASIIHLSTTELGANVGQARIIMEAIGTGPSLSSINFLIDGYSNFKMTDNSTQLLAKNTSTNELRFYETTTNGTDYIGFKAPTSRTSSTSVVIALPADDPTAGQVMQFSAPSGGVITASWVTPAGSTAITATAIAVGTGAGITGYVSDFYYSNATGEFNVSSAASNTYLYINPTGGQFEFGDLDVTGYKLYIADSGVLQLSAGQGLYINMSGANRLTTIGDSEFNGQNTYVRVNDATEVVTFSKRAITIGSLAYIFPSSQSANTYLKTDGSGNLTWASAGAGTVTSFSAGDLSPLFTTSEATATTTPALSFSLNTQVANTVFAGPATGADAAPTFRALVAADIPSLSGTYLTVDGSTTGATSQAQVFTSGIETGVIDDNGAGEILIQIGAVDKLTITTNGIYTVAGLVGTPAYSFSADSGTGFYLKTASSDLGASVNGALVGGYDTTGVYVGLAGTLTGTLKFNGATSGTVTVQSAAAAGTWTLTLPTTDGNSGEFLQTNGSGVTTWAAAAGAGANTALSNLASVSVNASLIPQSTLDLGDTTTAWRRLYLYGSGTFGSHSMLFTGTPTGHRVITFEDATQTVANLTSTQTFTTGVKTFNNQMFAIRNPANTFSYTFVAAAITANRSLTLPLITGTDTLACLGLAQAFSAEINLTKNGASVFSVGTTSFAYRTTNGGSGSSYQTVFNVDNSASTAGAQAFGFRTVDGFVFSVGNGTRQIARAMLQVINLVNTAGSEVGDLGFYVKASGAAAGLVLTLSSGSLTVADPYNFVFGTSTGTKLGTSTSQKIGIWNATPIVQPTTAIAAATFTANTSAIANDTATFDGYTMGQVVKALRNFGMLA